MGTPWKFAGMYGPNVILDQNSQEAANLSINVLLSGTTTVANLYTDQTKATGKTNPVTADAFGNFSFFADPGLYDLNYTLQGTPNKLTVSVNPYPGTSPYPDISARSAVPAGTALNAGGWLVLPISNTTWDAGSNLLQTEYVAPLTGLYSIRVSLGISPDTTTAGAFVVVGWGYQAAGTSGFVQKGCGEPILRSLNSTFLPGPVAILSDVRQINVGDAVQPWFAYSGVAGTAQSAVPYPSWFAIEYLGPI